MCSFKNAALLGLAAADRSLFTPVAAPYGQLAQPVTYGAPVNAANAYMMSADAFAQPLDAGYATEAPNADSQFWLLAGAGALALGAAAAALPRAPSAVAALDEADLESARVATLAVKGKEEPWSFTSFLQGPRKAFDGAVNGELELLSGVGRPASDSAAQLDKRFKIGYDTRSRKAPKSAAKPKPKAKPVTTWRSKASDSRLYPK